MHGGIKMGIKQMREKLLQDMECDDLCFMESNKELNEEAKEEEAIKQCPPCNEQ